MSCRYCTSTKNKLHRIMDIIAEPDVADRGRRGFADPLSFPTTYGRLIALAAVTAGVSLAELSQRAGYGKDYLVRVCRGQIKVTLRAARAFGPELGINLEGHVGCGGEAKIPPVDPGPQSSPAYMPGRCAADHPQLPLDGESRVA